MDHTVKIEFETTEKEMINLNLNHLLRGPAFLFFGLIGWGNLFYILASFLAEGSGATEHIHIIQWLLLAFSLFIPLTTLFRITQSIKRRFEAEQRSYTFDKKGFGFRTSSMQGSALWQDVRKVTMTKRMMVLYVGAKGVSLIPIRSFRSSEEQKQVKAWMAEGIDRTVYRGSASAMRGIYAAMLVIAAVAGILVLTNQA